MYFFLGGWDRTIEPVSLLLSRRPFLEGATYSHEVSQTDHFEYWAELNASSVDSNI